MTNQPKKKQPSSGKNQGQPQNSPSEEKSSAPATASNTTLLQAIKKSGLGLRKFPRQASAPTGKQGLSATEQLALSQFLRLLGQRKAPTKDALEKPFMNSLRALREHHDAPASDADSPLRRLLQECATDSLEKYFASIYPVRGLSKLSIYPANPIIKNQLVFRCFLVPELCEAWLQAAGVLPLKMSLFLRDYSSRVRALERLGWEMMIRGAGPDGVQIGGKTHRLPERAKEVGQLPRPPLDWLVSNSADAVQWLARFDGWHQAAFKSFCWFHQQFCADLGYPNPEKAFAAYLGYAQSKTPLTAELIQTLVKQPQLTGSKAFGLFAKNVASPESLKYGREFEKWVSGGKCGEAPGLVIDCWLIEIWPLVVAEEWGYTAILQIAKAKFGSHNLLENWKQLQRRCERLKLKLADRPARGGPGIEFNSPHPPLACLAAYVKGIAEQPEKWMHSRCGC